MKHENFPRRKETSALPRTTQWRRKIKDCWTREKHTKVQPSLATVAVRSKTRRPTTLDPFNIWIAGSTPDSVRNNNSLRSVLSGVVLFMQTACDISTLQSKNAYQRSNKTISMKQSASREADSRSNVQEIPRLLRIVIRKVHCRIHNNPPTTTTPYHTSN
jgi:hypothetical protein